MKTTIYVLCAGDGHRMQLDHTKALLYIPKVTGIVFSEQIITRLLHQLKIMGVSEDSVFLVSGYHNEDFDNYYHVARDRRRKIVVKNWENEVVDGIRQLSIHPEERTLFILGDVVWSLQALQEFFVSTEDFVFFSNQDMNYGEIFGLSVKGSGVGILQECLNSEELASPANLNMHETHCRYKKITECKLWDLWGHVSIFYAARTFKYRAQYPVDDIDEKQDYEIVEKGLREGYYDDMQK